MSWFGPPNSDCGCCKCPLEDCGDGTSEQNTQAVFTLAFSISTRLADIDSFGRYIDREYDLTPFNGTYTANKDYPGCSFNMVSVTKTINYTYKRYDAFCPNTLLSTDSGTVEKTLFWFTSSILIDGLTNFGDEMEFEEPSVYRCGTKTYSTGSLESYRDGSCNSVNNTYTTDVAFS